MNICIDSTFRKLTGEIQGDLDHHLPRLVDSASCPVNDWTPVYRYESSMHVVDRSFRNLRESSKSQIGPIAQQNRESIRDAALKCDFSALQRTFDPNRSMCFQSAIRISL